MKKAWINLVLAGISEVVWAYGLKASEGFTHLPWSIITIGFMIVSFYLFAKAMKYIPMGTAYAVFTGIGAAGTALLGVILLHESMGGLKLLSLLVLLSGIIGLKLMNNEKEVKS